MKLTVFAICLAVFAFLATSVAYRKAFRAPQLTARASLPLVGVLALGMALPYLAVLNYPEYAFMGMCCVAGCVGGVVAQLSCRLLARKSSPRLALS